MVHAEAPADTTKARQLIRDAVKVINEDPDKTISFLNNAIRLSMQLHDYDATGMALMKLANVYTVVGEPEAALRFYRLSRAVWKSLLLHASGEEVTRLQKLIAKATGMMGSVYYDSNRFSEALGYHLEAEKLFAAAGDTNNVIISHTLAGLAYHGEAKFTEALQEYLAGLKLAEAKHEIHLQSQLCGNIANYYGDLGESEQALAYYRRCIDLDKSIGNNQGLIGCLSNIGMVYSDKGKDSLALTYFMQAVKYAERLQDPFFMANCYTNIGDVLLKRKKYAEAKSFYERALAIEEKHAIVQLQSNTTGNMGELFLETGKNRNAEESFLRALELAESIGALDLVSIHHQRLSGLYQKTGKYLQAFEHYKKHIAARDSIFNEENTKKATQSEMNFEFEKKEAQVKAEQDKKDAIAEADRKRQSIILYVISAFGLFVLAFAVFAYRSFLQKKKTNAEITRQKHLIEEKQKEILDSIFYARRIQRSLLTPEISIRKALDRQRTQARG